jgi:hypothetical protein
VRGLNVQLATLSTDAAAPVIVRARLRRGNVASPTGAGRLLAQGLGTARAAGVAGRVLCRADSAYYGHAFVAAALRHRVWFSVTVQMNPQAKATIAGIGEDAWTPIKYPNAVWEEAEQRWVSDAEVAEVPFVAFTSRRKVEHVPCRLIVRRVRRLQPLAGDGSEQGELFAPTATTRSSPTPTWAWSRPISVTGATRSSSRSSPSSRTGPWHTCPRGSTRRTRHG